MPPPPPVEAGRTPPAVAALAGSGEDVPALDAAIAAIIYANNALQTVEALSARGANLQSFAASALIDMVVSELRCGVELNEDLDPEAAIGAALMGGAHVLMAAIHKADGGYLHTEEETKSPAPASGKAAALPTQPQ